MLAPMKFEQVGRSEPRAPVVILSAGLGGHGAFWRPQIQALGEVFRVIVYDHRGTGENASELGSGYSIENMADDVEQIVEAAGVMSYHLVGHALGGLVGLALARRAHHRCASLCLVNAWASLDVHTARCFDIRLSLLDHAGVEAYVGAQPIFLYPAVWISRNADLIVNDIAHGVRSFQGISNLRRRIAALRAFDATGDLHAITVPTLVSASRDDILVPYTKSQEMADHLPNARLMLVQEGGHAFSVTDPSSFNSGLIDFIQEFSRK
jgi:aminoacrylate hydrolase